ncbi:3448_t:CDS:2 [Funneliformis mosseae]|uniref:3448_t:CDS:1 n=1 Tax=Funneliformis mosseae TaxID=27381 RepID=A0A9N9D9I3_FUNMO|nr:3448_t:CDS:2 [Funneliformis mosseae]
MSDESLSLRHQRALEILQDPEFKTLKEWIEAGEPYKEDDDDLAYFKYKKSEARKNGVNYRSVNTVTESRPEPADVTLLTEKNKILEVCLGFTPTVTRSSGRKAWLVLPPANNLLYTKTINIMVKILNQEEFPSLT